MKIMVMGVSGTGKSTVGAALARALGLPFIDADDLHPATNRAKMAAGIPLTDEDRWPWLDAVAKGLSSDGVLACSALKRAYRDRLRVGLSGPLHIVYLEGSRKMIAQRLGARQGHFMPPALLESQLATLEAPGPDEAITARIDQPIDALLDQILIALKDDSL